MPDWAQPQYLEVSTAESGSPQAEHKQTHQNTRQPDLGGRFCRMLMSSPLWDYNTHWFTRRAGDGDKPCQAEPQNSHERSPPDNYGSWGWEEARQGQAATPAGTCKIQTWKQAMPSRAAAPACTRGIQDWEQPWILENFPTCPQLPLGSTGVRGWDGSG